MFLQKTFQCSRSLMFFKLGVIVNFLIITRNMCRSLLLIHALIKLQDWWLATLLKKRPQHRCFPVNVLKCLKKTFYGTPPVAASENGFEEFLRISKGDLTQKNLYDLTNFERVNCEIVATLCIQMCMIWFLKDRMSSIFSDLYEEINQIRVIQIVLYKSFRVKQFIKEEFIKERDL